MADGAADQRAALWNIFCKTSDSGRVCDHFVEVYHGLQDIPKEHKVFSFPKLSIREQMAAYQEIIDGSSLEGYRQMQKKDRGDR